MMQSTIAPPRIVPPSGEGRSPLYWKGLHIGDLTPDGTWRKTIDSRRHWCRKHDAPGFQAEVYEEVRGRGFLRALEVFDRRSGCTFRASVEDVEGHAIRDTLNWADGEQVFLPRPFWTVEHPEGYQYPLRLAGAAAGS
jgi:hypothetical protein